MHVKKDFADVIKLRIINAITKVLVRGKQESQSEKLEIQQKQEIRVEEGRGDKAGTSKS